MWFDSLAKQDPAAVADLLIPHLVTGGGIVDQAVQLAGRVADERVVAPLQAIMEQRWGEQEYDDYDHFWPQPPTMAAMALMDSPCSSARLALLRSSASPDPAIRLRVLVGIHLSAYRNDSRLSPTTERRWDAPLQGLLFRALTDAHPAVRWRAADLMGMRSVEGVESILIEMSRSADAQARTSAIRGLSAEWYGHEARRRIVECLKDQNAKVQLYAVHACRLVADPPPTTELLEVLSSADERVREAACSLLQRKAHVGDLRVFPAMLRLMDDPSRSVRQRAEIGLYFAAATAEQKQAAAEASRRLRERDNEGRPNAP